MGMRWILVTGLVSMAASVATAQQPETDVIETSAGPLEIRFVGHGSLVFSYGAKVIHVDPYSRVADYTTLPKADLVLITHAHGDHLDPAALAAIRGPQTQVVAAADCEGKLEGATVLRNGEQRLVAGVAVTAVPAYNLVNRRPNGAPFHAPGQGNGYTLAFGDTRVYVAGDTENIPEMKALRGIRVAFLPMNLPYTMTPEMVADAARAFRPAILYPYHYGDTNPQELVKLLAAEKDIDVRVRRMP